MNPKNKRFLTAKAEDLLSPLSGETVRQIATKSLKNKASDLVSDPNRDKSDTSPQDNIDKAAMGGVKVHQE